MKLAEVEKLATADWQAMLGANLTGPFLLCRAAMPHLKRRGGGSIVNVSSLAGQNPFAGGACYAATKAGLDAFSHALMQELRQHDIRVSVVAPGSVATGFSGHAPTAADSWKLSPEDVAETIFHLVTHPVAEPAVARRSASLAAAEGIAGLQPNPRPSRRGWESEVGR